MRDHSKRRARSREHCYYPKKSSREDARGKTQDTKLRFMKNTLNQSIWTMRRSEDSSRQKSDSFDGRTPILDQLAAIVMSINLEDSTIGSEKHFPLQNEYQGQKILLSIGSCAVSHDFSMHTFPALRSSTCKNYFENTTGWAATLTSVGGNLIPGSGEGNFRLETLKVQDQETSIPDQLGFNSHCVNSKIRKSNAPIKQLSTPRVQYRASRICCTGSLPNSKGSKTIRSEALQYQGQTTANPLRITCSGQETFSSKK